VVTFGAYISNIWCCDSGWVSPLILVGPGFRLTPQPLYTGHALVSPHTPIGLPLWSLPSVSLGFQHFPFMIISGTQMVGGDLPICYGFGSILVIFGPRRLPSKKSLALGDP
jgi:hypothetical protein